LKSQDHSKYFIGIGYNLVFSEELSTGLEIIYGTNSTLEAKLSGTSSGIYIDWMKFYINNIFVIDATTNLAFIKHEILNASTIHYDASARLVTNTAYIRYNFINRMFQNKSKFNAFIGIGPSITKFKKLKASMDDFVGTHMTVQAKYSNYVPGISSKFGIEFLTQPLNWENSWLLFSLDIRYCFALKKQSIIQVEQKQNNVIIPSGLIVGDKVNPTNFSLCFGLCFGFK
jgi:hypothetical protein